MFRIKICGVTTLEDAVAAANAGADAIGLNFYPSSPRCVSVAVAEEIVTALPMHVTKVGVFVNAPAEEILRRVRSLKLDMVQLHGDEPPEFLVSLPGVPIVRAFRPDGDLDAVANYLSRCDQLNCRPTAVLIDAFRSGHYGGTGETANWSAIRAGRSHLGSLPMVLAGGLGPGNVAEAIQSVRPNAVDTASGVEISPGRKSVELMQAFVSAARSAFDKPSQS